jgi:hypothetical protein
MRGYYTVNLILIAAFSIFPHYMKFIDFEINKLALSYLKNYGKFAIYPSFKGYLGIHFILMLFIVIFMRVLKLKQESDLTI